MRERVIDRDRERVKEMWKETDRGGKGDRERERGRGGDRGRESNANTIDTMYFNMGEFLTPTFEIIIGCMFASSSSLMWTK